MAPKKEPLEIGTRVRGVLAEEWSDSGKKRPAYVEPRETVVGAVAGVYPFAVDVVQVVSDAGNCDLVTVRDPEILTP